MFTQNIHSASRTQRRMRSSFTPLSNDLRVQTLRNLILNNLVIRHETGPKDKTTIEFPKLGETAARTPRMIRRQRSIFEERSE
jgi:hypothetical protein